MATDINCFNCKKIINEEEYVNIDEKYFHIEHFNCKICSKRNNQFKFIIIFFIG